MRARNLKPGLFKNEILGSADPLYTILFEGLWCSADREGRLEDRPLRICAEVFPYRRKITEKKISIMLQWLHDQKFIERYKNDEGSFIQVLEFAKHQNPHQKEAPSVIQPLSNVLHGAGTGKEQDQHDKRTVQDTTNSGTSPADSGLLTPDSGSLTPDCSLRESESNTPPSAPPTRAKRADLAQRIPDDFTLTAERRAVAETEKLNADRTFAKFTDYWRSTSGAKARKLDWDATWRNWCRSEADRNRPLNGHANKPQPISKFDRVIAEQGETHDVGFG